MRYESIAHEAEGRMGYWLRADGGERNNCFSKIQLVGQKISRQNIFRSASFQLITHRMTVIIVKVHFPEMTGDCYLPKER